MEGLPWYARKGSCEMQQGQASPTNVVSYFNITEGFGEGGRWGVKEKRTVEVWRRMELKALKRGMSWKNLSSEQYLSLGDTDDVTDHQPASLKGV